MIRSRAMLASLCLCMSLLPTSPYAQGRSRLNTGLNSADLQAMGAVAARLYQQDNVANGTTDHWANPKSGNRGSVTVVRSFTNAANPCREVRYVIQLHNRRGARSYNLNWCRTAAGVWKIS